MKVHFHFEVTDLVLRCELLAGIVGRRERTASFCFYNLSREARMALSDFVGLNYQQLLWTRAGNPVKQVTVHLVRYQIVATHAGATVRVRPRQLDVAEPKLAQIEEALIATVRERDDARQSLARIAAHAWRRQPPALVAPRVGALQRAL